MTKEDIERYIESGDSEIEDFDICEKEWLCQRLYRAEDPQVRYELASNEAATDAVLEELVKDPDINA